MSNIQDIIPFIKDGWVAMDKNGAWWWYSEKPFIGVKQWHTEVTSNTGMIDDDVFDIAPAKDWTKSLIKVGKSCLEDTTPHLESTVLFKDDENE